ncbi:MAG: glycosyltransferase family 39 protein [Candidatus Omnitrophota bacterium]
MATNLILSGNKYKEILYLILSWVIIFISRLVLLLKTDDFHALAAGKVLIIDHFLRNPFILKDAYIAVHPPGHLFFLFITLKLFYDTLFAPRLVSLLFGSVLVFPFYYYTKSIFNTKIAVFSLFAIALYSQHIIYSVIATQDTTFHFFLFLSFLLFFFHCKTQNQKYLFFTALALGFTGLCRYEGMAFIPLFTFFIAKNNFKRAIVFFLLASLLPLSWIFINYKFGDNSTFFDFSSCFGSGVPMQFHWIRSQGFKIDFIDKLLYWPLILVNTLGWATPILGLGGIIYCLKEKKNFFSVTAFIMLFLMFMVKTLEEQVYLQPRYSITLGLMLIPFSLYALFKIASLLKINIKFANILAVILLATMISAIGQNILSEPLFAPSFAKNIAVYLKHNVNEKDCILVDDCGDEKYKEPIKLLSKVNPKQFVFAVLRIEQNGRWVIDEKMFFDALEKHNVTCLLYSPYGSFASVLKLNPGKIPDIINGFIFAMAYENGPYQVYWVKKDPEKRKN